MADLAGKLIVITGATNGIGEATAIAMHSRGAELVLPVRNRKKGIALAEKLQERVALIDLDLSNLNQCRKAAQHIFNLYPKIDVLINNAGFMGYSERRTTEEGFELTFATNYLGPWTFTQNLLPSMREGSRIVNLSSMSHRNVRFNQKDIQFEKGYQSFRAYAHSKLLIALFTLEAAKRFAEKGILVNSSDPGIVKSGIDRTWSKIGRAVYKIGAPFMDSPEKGASTSIMLAVDEIAEVSGGYFKNKKQIKPSRDARNESYAKWLWETTRELTEPVLQH